MEKVEILGVKVSQIDFKQALEKIEDYLDSEKQHYIVTPNPEIILAAQEDEELKQILNSADLALPDGFGLKLMTKIKYRVAGTDVFLEILKKFKALSFKFIVKEDGLSKKEEIIKSAGVKIDEDSPDIIFIGLGSPGQEKWIADQADKYPRAKVLMVVGGGFDFLTGRQKRAPKLMRRLGLEWLYRLFRQPRRYKRIFNATVKFIWRQWFSDENRGLKINKRSPRR